MQKWERKPPDGGYIEIYNAVFEAAAILPLNGNGDFRTTEFFHKVEEIAAKEDAEEAAQKGQAGTCSFRRLPSVTYLSASSGLDNIGDMHQFVDYGL
jgi:hypothetical protein